MKLINIGHLPVCVQLFYAFLVSTSPIEPPAQPTLIQPLTTSNASSVLGADNNLHLPTTPQITLTQSGVSVTFQDYGSQRLRASDTQALLQQLGDSFTHNRASQAIMQTIWELDYHTTNLLMNYVPGPRATWATFAIVTDLIEQFWRDWDRVTIYFEVDQEDGEGGGFGEGFIATKEMYRRITGRGW